MLKKLGVVTLGVAAGLVAASPLASAHEAPAGSDAEAGSAATESSTPAVAAPVGDGTLADLLDASDVGLGGGGNAQSLSGNGTFVNGHQLSS